jgi:hypothetical protein
VGHSSQTSKPVPFLSLPLEIRSMVYDHFLPEKPSSRDNELIQKSQPPYGADPTSEDDFAIFGNSLFQVDESEVDGGDSSYFPYNCQVERIFHVYRRFRGQCDISQTIPHDNSFPGAFVSLPTPAIMGTCRQIYDEMMSLICSPTFTILISSNGIFFEDWRITFEPLLLQHAAGLLESIQVLSFFRDRMRRLQHLRVLYLVDNKCQGSFKKTQKFHSFLAAAYARLVRQLLDHGHEKLRFEIQFYAHQHQLAPVLGAINFGFLQFVGLKTGTETSFELLKLDSNITPSPDHPAAGNLQSHFLLFGQWLRDGTTSP